MQLGISGLAEDAELKQLAGRVSDSGEGGAGRSRRRSTRPCRCRSSPPLYQHFSSRGKSNYQDKLLSVMRFQFGGHVKKPKQQGTRHACLPF